MTTVIKKMLVGFIQLAFGAAKMFHSLHTIPKSRCQKDTKKATIVPSL